MKFHLYGRFYVFDVDSMNRRLAKPKRYVCRSPEVKSMHAYIKNRRRRILLISIFIVPFTLAQYHTRSNSLSLHCCVPQPSAAASTRQNPSC